MNPTTPSLPPEVRKEIDEITARGIGSEVFTEDLERIALLAYRSGVEAGVRAAKEAAAKICDNREAAGWEDASMWALELRNLPEPPIVESVLKGKP